MIGLDYNIYMEVAVIPLDIVLYVYLWLKYTNMTRVNVAFRRFAFIVMIADVFDVATAIVTSAHGEIANFIHYFFNITDSILTSLAAFAFIYYIYAYSSMRESGKRLRNIMNFSLLAINLLLLLTNPLTGWVFTYDSAGNYIHEVLFVPVAYGFPILFFAIGSLYMLTHRERYRKNQVKAMVFSIIVTGGVFLLQMLFFDNMLITLFIASIGVLVIFLSLENPDYVRLLEARAELNESREREAALKVKEKLSGEMMLAFSKAVDAKDHYTNGHSQRVAQYAKELGRRMGKGKEEQDDLYAVGLLHDIGKIGISVNIINKKGALDEEEFETIKTHTVIGWEILQSISELPKLATGARWHHEKYDGSGYPDGLSGKDIPEEARIICLADCYDAMTSKRSYSSPRSQAEAREEIVRCMGTHFDPDIAKYMLDMIDDDKEFKLREED